MALLTEQCSQSLASFAESIQNTETWQEWSQAQQALENDAALMRLFARYEELSGAMRNAQAHGGGLSGEQMVETGPGARGNHQPPPVQPPRGNPGATDQAPARHELVADPAPGLGLRGDGRTEEFLLRMTRSVGRRVGQPSQNR